jgi:hypothetical protein
LSSNLSSLESICELRVDQAAIAHLCATVLTQLRTCYYSFATMDDRHKWWPRMFVRLLSLARKNPIFEIDIKSVELHELVDRTNPVELDELEFVESMAKPNKTTRCIKFILNVWIASYLIKKAHYCYTMLVEYNVLSVGSRLVVERDESTGQRLYSFACLASNCSTLFDPLANANRSKLMMDELPVFAICHPHLARFSEPSDHTTKLGIYVTALAASFYTILFILQSEQVRLRTRNPLLLFLATPNISRRLNFLRTKKHAEDLHRSFMQYQQTIWTKRFTYNKSGAAPHLDAYEPQSSDRRSVRSKASSSDNSTQPPKWDYLSWEKRRFVYDCFPLIRLEQWRQRVCDMLLVLSGCVLMSFVAISTTSLWAMNSYLDRKRWAMAEFQLELTRTSCSIWHADTNEPVRITSLQYGLNTFGALSLITVLFVVPTLSLSLTGLLVLASSLDLRCLICELKYKIIMSLPVIKNMTDAMLRERARFESSHRRSYLDAHNRLEYTLRDAGGGQQAVTNEFKYGKLREKFVKDVRVVSLALLNRPFLGRQLPLETQAFIMRECFDKRLTSAVGLPHWPTILAELLEKLYVEFRILDDLVTETHPDISVLTGASAAMCYAAFLVTLIICKFTESISPEQYFVLLVTFFGAIGMTLNSAILLAKVSSQLFQFGLLLVFSHIDCILTSSSRASCAS